MISKNSFAREYQRLNKNQRVAVDTISGPVMVLAGPGTGKTQVLTLRIANILKKTDTPPNNILALTFTDAASNEMRERLVKLIGQPAYSVQISTFHSFCQSVILENPDLFIVAEETQHLQDLDRTKILKKIINNNKFSYLKPLNAPYYYVLSIIGNIRSLKREGVNPKEFNKILKQKKQQLKINQDTLSKTAFVKEEKDLLKNIDLQKIYSLYQQELFKQGKFDFEDMINWVVDKFENDKNLLLSYQERFSFFLVDEYQDTNSAQNQLVYNLTSFWKDQANLFVVGDVNQCLPAGSKINTLKGIKNIEDIKKGDKVLSAVGKGYTSHLEVTNTFKQKKNLKLLTFTTKSGKTLSVTDNHKMFCFIPPREISRYWYVYLMYKKNLGWRIGTTKSLPVRLKVESGADKIIGINAYLTESKARYAELVLSLRYQIPTIVFSPRKGVITDEWIKKIHKEFDTDLGAKKLANSLNIDLDSPHYMRDATSLGNGRTKINLMMCSRSYRSKYAKVGLLHHPQVLHELQIQTSNKQALQKLKSLNFKLRNHNIGKGLRLTSTKFSKLLRLAKMLEKKLPGMLDIKASLGTVSVQHRPSRIMPAKNILPGNYLPVLKGYKVIYEEVVSRKEQIKTCLTYDLEVPPAHNYIANSVIIHNSIFRFQGASLENTKEFISHFPNVTLINLNQNYRSTKNILSSAHAVITNNSPKAVKLKSSLTNPGKLINLANFKNSLFEDYYIAQSIEKLIKKGTPPKNIAIIVRHNKDLDDVSIILKKFSIPHNIQGGQDLFEKPLIKQLLIFLTIINHSPHQHLDNELFTLLNLNFFEIDPFDILKTAKKASDNRVHLASYIISGKHQVPKSLKTFFQNLNKWQKDSANYALPEFFEKLIQQSGILNYLLKQKDKVDKLNQLNMFFTQIKNMAFQDKTLNLSKFLTNIEALKEQGIKTTISPPLLSTNSVTLTTAHKAKGLEWSHVYIYRCIDGKWGNPRVRQLIKLPPETLEFTAAEDRRSSTLGRDNQNEERRIFYVSQTRAKKTLTITSASQYTTNYGTQNTLPSAFVNEIPTKLTKKIITNNLGKTPTKILKKNLSVPPVNSFSTKEGEYLKNIIKDLKLSVTALTTFIDCAYKFKLNNLYRLPKAKEAYLAFGTATHTALEKYHQVSIKTSKLPKLDFLLDQFKKALEKEVLKKEDYKIRLEHGIDILTSYYKLQLKNIKPTHTLEKYFGYSSSSNCRLGNISLIGKVDKIDILDKAKKTAQIVDYKTGKPKTKGEIEGTTKTSTGYLKRQLVFYSLLAKLDKNFPLKVTKFQLDFVEQPHLKNKSGQMNFTVSEKEIEDLKVVIKQAMKKIRSLKFPRTKDTSHCQRCEFKTHCWPSGIPLKPFNK